MLNSTRAFVAALVRVATCAMMALSMGLAQRPQTAARVTAVRLEPPRIEQYDGPCGSKLDLQATITVTGPGTVWFRFDAPQDLKITGGHEGTMTFTRRGEGGMGRDVTFHESRSGQIRLEAAMEIEGGGHGPTVLSNPVTFHFNCAGQTPAGEAGTSPRIQPTRRPTVEMGQQAHQVGRTQEAGTGLPFGHLSTGGSGARIGRVWVHPDYFKGSCPHQYTFYVGLQSTGVGEVRYTWLRSDGATSTPKVISFSGPNQSRTVQTSWTLAADPGKTDKEWEQLQLDPPNGAVSQKIPITLVCTQ